MFSMDEIEPGSSQWSNLQSLWQACTVEEQQWFLNQHDAVILTGRESPLQIRALYFTAVRTRDLQTRIREWHTLRTVLGLTLQDIFPAAKVKQAEPSSAVTTAASTPLLLKWIREKWTGPTISLRDIYGRGPRSVHHDRQSALAQAEILERNGFLIPLKSHRRDRRVWKISIPATAAPPAQQAAESNTFGTLADAWDRSLPSEQREILRSIRVRSIEFLDGRSLVLHNANGNPVFQVLPAAEQKTTDERLRSFVADIDAAIHHLLGEYKLFFSSPQINGAYQERIERMTYLLDEINRAAGRVEELIQYIITGPLPLGETE
jgi:hypothetical protein